jgi:ribonuclease HI
MVQPSPDLHGRLKGARKWPLLCSNCNTRIQHIARNYRVSDHVSVFTAELAAIVMALEWIADAKPLHSVILSDCLSALNRISDSARTIASNVIFDILHLYTDLAKQNICIDFEWVPSDIGIHGNEMDHTAAKSAINTP